MKFYLYLCFLLIIHIPFAHSQRVANVRAQAKGNIVMITYDLLGTISGQLYTIAIYSSHDGMAKPLTHVKGDIGTNIKPGQNKFIEWGVKKELLNFDDEVTLEVRATLTFSPMRFTSPQKNELHKRGKSYKLTWLGAVANENLQIELFNDTSRVYEINRTNNKGTLEWEIPLNTEPGKNYRYKISSVDNPSNFAYSNSFIIKRKTPTWVKVLPITAVVSGIAYYILSTNGSKGVDTEAEKDLPLPPDPQ
jgi:hypothetical protein